MGESGAGRSRGALPLAMRLLLVAGFIIAAAATVLVVIAEDVRLLRLAAVLALWAALIAAFAVTRSRRDARAAAMREDEAQLAYQLELHREVAARREYEADLTQQLANEQSGQLGELREQLDRLTGVLASLIDGEVTVSRLTLSAESARFRPASASIAQGAPATVTSGVGAPLAIGDGAAVDTIDAVAAPGAVPGPGPHAWSGVAPGPDGRGRVEAPAAAWARRHADLVRESRDAESGAPAASPVPPRTPAPPSARTTSPAPAPSATWGPSPAPAPSPAPVTSPRPARPPSSVWPEPTPAPSPASASTLAAVSTPDAAATPSPEPGPTPDPTAATVPHRADGAPDGPAPAERAAGIDETEPDEQGTDGHGSDEHGPDGPGPDGPGPDEPESGEHESGGVSVSELLAAYGLSGTGRRRRRG
jgi:hypothetical protein